jgi:hypothetical protein
MGNELSNVNLPACLPMLENLCSAPPMTQQTPAPPPPHQPAAPPLRPQGTLAAQRIFLVALLDFGCVARAARAAGMSRSSAYALRRRLAGTAFARTWDEVLARHAARQADPFSADAYPHAKRPAPPAAPGGSRGGA